jgi:hypothetical protein
VIPVTSSQPIDILGVNQRHALAIAVQGSLREEAMADPKDYLHCRFYLHYRLFRDAVTAITTVGAALLFSYLILQGRW